MKLNVLCFQVLILLLCLTSLILWICLSTHVAQRGTITILNLMQACNSVDRMKNTADLGCGDKNKVVSRVNKLIIDYDMDLMNCINSQHENIV